MLGVANLSLDCCGECSGIALALKFCRSGAVKSRICRASCLHIRESTVRRLAYCKKTCLPSTGRVKLGSLMLDPCFSILQHSGTHVPKSQNSLRISGIRATQSKDRTQNTADQFDARWTLEGSLNTTGPLRENGGHCHSLKDGNVCMDEVLARSEQVRKEPSRVHEDWRFTGMSVRRKLSDQKKEKRIARRAEAAANATAEELMKVDQWNGIMLLNFLAALYGTNAVANKFIEVAAVSPPASLACAIKFGAGALAFSPALVNMFDSENLKDKGIVLAGLELATWLMCGIIAQSVGLGGASASGNASLLFAFTVVLVPLLEIFTGRRKISKLTWMATLAALGALGLLKDAGGFSLDLVVPKVGDILGILSSVFFAAQIFRAEMLCSKHDPLKLTAVQLVFMFMVALGWEGWTLQQGGLDQLAQLEAQLPMLPWSPLLYSGLICGGVAAWVELNGLRNVHASTATFIYTTIPVWGGFMTQIVCGEGGPPNLQEALISSLFLGGATFFALLTAPEPKSLTRKKEAEKVKLKLEEEKRKEKERGWFRGGQGAIPVVAAPSSVGMAFEGNGKVGVLATFGPDAKKQNTYEEALNSSVQLAMATTPELALEEEKKAGEDEGGGPNPDTLPSAFLQTQLKFPFYASQAQEVFAKARGLGESIKAGVAGVKGGSASAAAGKLAGGTAVAAAPNVTAGGAAAGAGAVAGGGGAATSAAAGGAAAGGAAAGGAAAGGAAAGGAAAGGAAAGGAAAGGAAAGGAAASGAAASGAAAGGAAGGAAAAAAGAGGGVTSAVAAGAGNAVQAAGAVGAHIASSAAVGATTGAAAGTATGAGVAGAAAGGAVAGGAVAGAGAAASTTAAGASTAAGAAGASSGMAGAAASGQLLSAAATGATAAVAAGGGALQGLTDAVEATVVPIITPVMTSSVQAVNSVIAAVPGGPAAANTAASVAGQASSQIGSAVQAASLSASSAVTPAVATAATGISNAVMATGTSVQSAALSVAPAVTPVAAAVSAAATSAAAAISTASTAAAGIAQGAVPSAAVPAVTAAAQSVSAATAATAGAAGAAAAVAATAASATVGAAVHVVTAGAVTVGVGAGAVIGGGAGTVCKAIVAVGDKVAAAGEKIVSVVAPVATPAVEAARNVAARLVDRSNGDSTGGNMSTLLSSNAQGFADAMSPVTSSVSGALKVAGDDSAAAVEAARRALAEAAVKGPRGPAIPLDSAVPSIDFVVPPIDAALTLIHPTAQAVTQTNPQLVTQLAANSHLVPSGQLCALPIFLSESVARGLEAVDGLSGVSAQLMMVCNCNAGDPQIVAGHAETAYMGSQYVQGAGLYHEQVLADGLSALANSAASHSHLAVLSHNVAGLAEPLLRAGHAVAAAAGASLLFIGAGIYNM